MEWVPVSLRLPNPEGNERYLVTTAHYDPNYKGRFVMIDEYDARDPEGPPNWCQNPGRDGIRVVAWMSLPKPYGESEGFEKRIKPLKEEVRSTGHWEIISGNNSRCSICGVYNPPDSFNRPVIYNYCPFCGAKNGVNE